MTVGDMIVENERRLARIRAPYDPLEGDRKDPGRILEDFPFWAASCVRIKPKGGGEDIPFVLNPPQRKLVEALEEMRRAGKPIRLILLKARQWGGSTCVQIYMAWLQMVHDVGLNSLIIAHQGIATDEIKSMFDRMLENYPEKLLVDAEGKPAKGRRMVSAGISRGNYRIPARDCQVKLGTAERPDSCRGGDYNLVHCSEVALWKTTGLKTPEAIMRAACSGVLLKPMTMIVLESTANGTGNFFHREYQDAREGKSQFKALFVAWYEIPQYSLPLDSPGEFAAWLLARKDAEQAPDSRSEPGRYLWLLWERGATLEAINWYVAERRKFSAHSLMAAEYPSDDVEAFAHSGRRVFDMYKVEALRRDCCIVPMVGEIDSDAAEGSGAVRNPRFNASEGGALKIWEDRAVAPEGTRFLNRYLAVVDIGGRSDVADWSVIAVFDRDGMQRGLRPRVVAQWRGHSDIDRIAWTAARIAAYYNEALLVVESNTLETNDPERLVEGGDQSHYILNQIRNVYPNLYARRQSEDDVVRGVPKKYGFHTNVATKPMIISNLVKIIREGLYVERDSDCLDEYLTYEQRPNGSYGAILGRHDDILMTRAIGLHICFNEMDLPRVAQTSATRRLRNRPSSLASF